MRPIVVFQVFQGLQKSSSFKVQRARGCCKTERRIISYLHVVCILFYLLGVTFHHDGVRVVQLGPVVLDEVEEGSGVTAAAVGVVAQP